MMMIYNDKDDKVFEEKPVVEDYDVEELAAKFLD